MKPTKYSAQLYVKLEPKTRLVIEKMAENDQLSLGEAARALLSAGIAALGLS